MLFVCTSETVVEGFLELAREELTGWRRADGDRRHYPGRTRVFFCVEEALYDDGEATPLHFLADDAEHRVWELGRLIEFMV